MSLDENFQPTDVSGALEGVCADSGLPAMYQGTLDALYMFREDARSDIHDLKTHPRPYDPSTPEYALQGKMYSIFVLRHFSWVEKVNFRLIFTRFKNLFREVTYTRADIPSLIESIKAVRARQEMLHQEYDTGAEMEATPGGHCQYCTLLSDRSCPIGSFNENMQLSDEDRLRFKIWDSVFSRVNTKVLSDKIQATGRNIVVRDYNGKAYSFGPIESESEALPLFQATADGIAMDKEGNPVMPIVSLLLDYAHATPDDTLFLGKLTISSTPLSTPRKAKKRAFLDQALRDTAEKVTKSKLKVSKPLDAIPEDEEDDREEWDDGEDTEF